MPNALTMISHTKLGSDTAAWNFTSIPQTYQTLIIRGQVRTSESATVGGNLRFQLNNNGASTYNTSDFIFTGGSVFQNYNSHITFGRLEYTNANNAAANYGTIFEWRIEDYTGSQDKRVVGWAVTFDASHAGYTLFQAHRTSFSSAITELNLFSNSANIKANSQIWLFGLPES